jgi:general secretion pathway protein I
VTTRRGFTLLEMIVATTILAVAVVGVLAGLASTARNAARLQDYDRAVQLARSRMSELMLDRTLPLNTVIEGRFDPAQTGGAEAGWRVRQTILEMPPVVRPGQTALSRLELEVWWLSGNQRRVYTLDAYRLHPLKPDEIPSEGSQ